MNLSFMKLIGLTSDTAGNHDSSAAYFSGEEVKYAISEERITRRKHDNSFPNNSIKEILDEQKLKLKDIDYFVSGTPQVKLGKFLSTYLKGFRFTSLWKIIQWIVGRAALFVNGNENPPKKDGARSFKELGLDQKKLIRVPHYLAHAETAYTYSGMENCLVVSWDGYGIDGNGAPLCGTIYMGKDGRLVRLEDVPVYTSLALYYGAVTVALGFKLNDGEGKTMGLAAYGKKSPALKLVRKVFPFFQNGEWVARSNWLEITGVSRPEYFRFTPTYRYLRYLIEEHGAEQVAFAAQTIFEHEAGKFFKYLISKYKTKKVAVAGGIFLNVKFNMKLLKEGIVDDIFVYPNPGDGGVAVGAAIAGAKILGEKVRRYRLESVALGKEYSKREIKKAISAHSKEIAVKDWCKSLYREVALEIAKGKVIGWFVGRDEWGPRALGQRSVLADPGKVEIKDRINDRMKQRDWFMPFAPVVLEEYVDKVLSNGYGTPFMTLTDDIKKEMLDRIPAAIHVDGTARAQIIKRETNEPYWKVLNEFYKLTGVPVLLNTSFNRHGLPIVHTPEEAVQHLLWGCVDELVMDTYMVKKK